MTRLCFYMKNNFKNKHSLLYTIYNYIHIIHVQCTSYIHDQKEKIKIILYTIISTIFTFKNKLLFVYIGESKRIRTLPENGHPRYLRNHKSYKKNV